MKQIQRTLRSREETFETLVERVWKRTYWTALDILGDPAEAEDICQEALLKAYESWEEFRQMSSPDTWVYRILVNLCLNQRRRKSIWHKISQTLRLQNDDPVDWEGYGSFLNPEQRLRDHETMQAIHRAMDALSPQQRAVFSLRYLQGFTLQEVADVMDTAVGTIKSHIYRALQTMRKQLSEDFWCDTKL